MEPIALPSNKKPTNRINRYLPFLAFIIIAILMAHFLWQGADLKFDDANYLTYGHQVLNGTYNITESPYAYGSAFVGTVALGLLVSHGAAWGASIPQIIEFILIISIAYLCLIKYFTKGVSLVTALGAECSAFASMYITRVLPDFLLGLLIAIMFLIIIYKSKDRRFMLLAGFIAGLAIFVKLGGFALLILLAIRPYGIYIALIVAAIVGVLLLLKQTNRALFTTGIFGALGLYQILLPKDVSIFSIALAYDANQVHLSLATLPINITALLINFIGYYPPYFSQIFCLGALGILAIIGTVIILKKKDRRLYFIVLAFWVSVLYMYFGTESLTSYVYITTVSRYFIEFLIPMAILAGAAISYLQSKAPKSSEILFLEFMLFIILVSNIIPYLIFIK